MTNYEKRVQALLHLMPLGGWSCDDISVTIHEGGLAHGYSVPTEGEISISISELEPLNRLAELDKTITRDGETVARLDGRTLTPKEQEAKDEKDAIRATL